MAKVNFDISISLDGFVTASNVSPDEPAGCALSRWPSVSDSAEMSRIRRIGFYSSSPKIPSPDYS